LLALFRQDLSLTHFPPELLRSRPGWDQAFAETIVDLEGAGLRPEDLEASDDGRLRDIALIWRALDASAGSSWTAQRIFREAILLLDGRPELWPFPGTALAAVDGHETRARARFLQAIPGGMLASSPPARSVSATSVAWRRSTAPRRLRP
jgi:hypothetical protein